MRKKIYLLFLLSIFSCKTGTETKNIAHPHSDFLKSKGFNQAQNQHGVFVDFTFQIDTLTKIKYDEVDFYKLNLTAYDSIYIGKSNDTIFSFDQKINFKEVFVILDDKKTSYLGRLGIDYEVSLINYQDTTFSYAFKKIENTDEGDYRIMGYEYPELSISNLDITTSGKIIDLMIEQK